MGKSLMFSVLKAYTFRALFKMSLQKYPQDEHFTMGTSRYTAGKSLIRSVLKVYIFRALLKMSLQKYPQDEQFHY